MAVGVGLEALEASTTLTVVLDLGSFLPTGTLVDEEARGTASTKGKPLKSSLSESFERAERGEATE